MAYNNGKITAPVSIVDVKTALGISSTDLRTLCMSAQINVWSKYRPLPLLKEDDTPAPILEAIRKNYNYGIISMGAMSSIDEVGNELAAILNSNTDGDYTIVHSRKWNYNYVWTNGKLTESLDTSLNQFARLSDFSGYDHNATLTTNTLADSVDLTGGHAKSILPAISSDSRNITVYSYDSTKQIALPKDDLIIAHYLSSDYTDAKGDGTSLTILDSISRKDGGTNSLTAAARRGILLFRKVSVAGTLKYVLVGYWFRHDNRTYTDDGDLYANSAYNDNVDFMASTATPTVKINGKSHQVGWIDTTYAGADTWSGLAGDFVAVDCYYDEGNSMYAPILNMAYAISITRTTVVTANLNDLSDLADKVTLAIGGATEDDGGIAVPITRILSGSNTISSLFSSLTVGLYNDQYGVNLISGTVIAWDSLVADSTANIYDYLQQWTTGTTDVAAYVVIRGTTKTNSQQGILSKSVTLKKYK